jgi:hypothetical protein
MISSCAGFLFFFKVISVVPKSVTFVFKCMLVIHKSMHVYEFYIDNLISTMNVDKYQQELWSFFSARLGILGAKFMKLCMFP